MQGNLHRRRIVAVLAALLVCMLCAACKGTENGQSAAGDTGTQNTDGIPAFPCESGELIAMARAYYEDEGGFLAPKAECTPNNDGTYTLHLYEIVEDGEDSWHTATACWYTVDAFGTGTDDVMGTAVQLKLLSVADTAAYLEIPVKLLYVQDTEAHNEWEIDDPEVITSCLEALQQIETGQEMELRASDAGETLVFEMADKSTWTLSFESGNLLKNGICYETKGYHAVDNVLKDYLAKEEY